MRTSIWWIRRDLRLRDNQALAGATADAKESVPVFILDEKLLASPYMSTMRLAFLLEGLRSLDASLKEKGSRLVVRKGDPAKELSILFEETRAEAIFAEGDVSPYARRRDQHIAANLPLRTVWGLTVHAPARVLKADGKPYTVFTPFSRAWKALPAPTRRSLLRPPERIVTPRGVKSLEIPPKPALPSGYPFQPGEAAAESRLSSFAPSGSRKQRPIDEYGESRNRLDLEGTSQLSPYLRFGMISARRAAVAALEAIESASGRAERQGAEAWLSELVWREFYVSILDHHPRVRTESYRKDLRSIRWRNAPRDFAAWCEGRTGYPIVDAGMRQLRRTGWIHNRARMIVASFLTKDLLIDWRWGERWFMQNLVDGDPAANNGGWQWTAGTGTDAAPYFRVFNPVLQGMRFDPEGHYVRRWVPELSAVPGKHIHKPWEMSPGEQNEAKCVVGQDYPQPIVSHIQARSRALAAYDRSRGR